MFYISTDFSPITPCTHDEPRMLVPQVWKRCYASASDWLHVTSEQPIRTLCVCRRRRNPAPTVAAEPPTPDISSVPLARIKLARLPGRLRAPVFLVDA